MLSPHCRPPTNERSAAPRHSSRRSVPAPGSRNLLQRLDAEVFKDFSSLFKILSDLIGIDGNLTSGFVEAGRSGYRRRVLCSSGGTGHSGSLTDGKVGVVLVRILAAAASSARTPGAICTAFWAFVEAVRQDSCQLIGDSQITGPLPATRQSGRPSAVGRGQRWRQAPAQ